jgi:hypothetical protein
MMHSGWNFWMEFFYNIGTSLASASPGTLARLEFCIYWEWHMYTSYLGRHYCLEDTGEF